MSNRQFFSRQAGRADRTKNVDDEPWGTTSSQSHFKAYEQSEARSARSLPTQVRPCLEAPSVASGTLRSPELRVWERHREDYRDPYAGSTASAVTASETSQRSAGSKSGSKRGSRPGQKYIPAAELVAMRPIPERSFDGISHYNQTQEEAQQARHDFFPYRDEFHPRSKRLLYEMALNKVTKGSDRGSVVSDDSQSCFTVASTAVSGKSGTGSKVSSVSRSSSMPGLKSGSSSRLPTADSLRVGGGMIGSVAKRRKEAFCRAPNQSDADRLWYAKKLEEEGPAGLVTGNFVASMYEDTLDKYGQRISQACGLLGGVRDHTK
eukprot:gb/GFBE01058339.1/.p1 GENE.gb/GFBE01058339.1/~~gb/GFBE01058339.1/.p1  ORF type:complete len:321 (+),score=50.91 gb/GFBE01058339.1/:1-963(+)